MGAGAVFCLTLAPTLTPTPTPTPTQCCGAGPFLTCSGSEYFFHRLRLRVFFDFFFEYFFSPASAPAPITQKAFNH